MYDSTYVYYHGFQIKLQKRLGSDIFTVPNYRMPSFQALVYDSY